MKALPIINAIAIHVIKTCYINTVTVKSIGYLGEQTINSDIAHVFRK